LRFEDSGGLEIAGLPERSERRPFTIEMWMKLTPTDRNHLLLSRGQSLLTWSGSARRDNSTGSLFHGQGSAAPLATDIAQWTHVALCDDGRLVQLYVNGDPFIACTPPTPIFGGSGPLRVGHSESAPAFYRRGFNGELRALRISSTARYAFRFQSPLTFDKDDQTELLLDFSKGEGHEAPDISGHGRHARMTGGKWVVARPTGTVATEPAPNPPAKPAAPTEPP
jgi:hypothetical protein